MKYTPTIILVLLSLISKGQQAEMGLNYVFSSPRGAMQNTISYANGFSMDYYFTPKTKLYSIGMEMNMNAYGHDKTRQTYTMDDGSTAPMDVVVNNNFLNLTVNGRYFLSEGRIRPYVTGKIGYSFFDTNLYIYDPDDADHCEPVESEILSKDGSILVSAGGGLRLELLPKKNPGKLYINLSTNYSLGGNVNYMNVDAPNPNNAAHTSDVYAKFINTQTQIVHQHHVGNVYTSQIKVMDFRLGISFRLGRK